MTIADIADLITIGVFIFGAPIVVWQIILHFRFSSNEKLIKAKEDELESVEPDVDGRTSGHLVTEKQRLAQVKAGKKPIERELERLKQERQFLRDKTLLIKK